jgi:hypothetical protein
LENFSKNCTIKPTVNTPQKMAAPAKPLHKDLSFWVVAVVLVGAASATQLYFGVPWFSQRLAQARPAPRSASVIQKNPAARHNASLIITNTTVERQAIKQANQTP